MRSSIKQRFEMRKKFINMIILLAFVFIALSMMVFFTKSFVLHSRLTRNDNPAFDITRVVAIERNSISQHSEIYNDGNFIQYQCIYNDSCLDLVNLGRVDSLFHHVEDIVEVTNTPIPFPYSLFSNLIAPEPFSVSAPIVAFYNVYSLPNSSINSVKLYIEGKIKNKISDSATTLKYELSANRIDIALNDGSHVELSYYLGKDNNKTDAELVFSINNGNLYVVVFTKALDIKAFINDMMRKL